MSAATIQEMVAEKIKTLYRVSHELEELFPGRHYTPDGHMIGSIGEALAACCYGLTLFEASAETHDAKASDGRLVQIKATQIDRVALSSEPKWLLVLQIHPDGTFSEVYNGPGKYTMVRASLPGHIAGKCRRTASGPSPWQSCEACRPRSRKRTG